VRKCWFDSSTGLSRKIKEREVNIMRYRIDFRFWGTTKTETRLVENADTKNRMLKELRHDCSITYISVCKVLKDGTILPVSSEIRTSKNVLVKM
jgi:hypothetical protein